MRGQTVGPGALCSLYQVLHMLETSRLLQSVHPHTFVACSPNAASIHARMMHVNVYLGPFRLPEIAQNYVLDTDMSGCESLATEGGCIVLKSLAACDM